MSSQVIRGKLEKCFKNKHGFYSIKVNDAWHNCAKNDYSNLEDNIVEFTIAENKKGYMDVKGNVEVVAAAPAERGNGGGGGQSGAERNESIIRQSSYKTAAEILSAAIAAEHVGVGAKAKAYDNILGLLDETAAHIRAGVIEGTFWEEAEAEDPSAPPSADFVPQEA